MGTSVSHPSPKTVNWQAATTAYLSDTISPVRACQELWRAATNQPQGNIAADLASPLIAQLVNTVSLNSTPTEAFASVRRHVAESGHSTLAADIAQRAVFGAFNGPDRPEKSFAVALFKEASNYLISRDLPGHLGASARTATVSDAIRLKRDLCATVESVAGGVHQPANALHGDEAAWHRYVNQVVKRLIQG